MSGRVGSSGGEGGTDHSGEDRGVASEMGRRTGWGWAGLAVAAFCLAWASCGGGEARGEAETAGATADTALVRLVEELLPAVERSSGLTARARPQLARSDSATLEGFLRERFEDQLPPERARALSAAYVRLGLLPDTLDLRGLLLKLYQEQVVGYYDPRVDTLFVLESVPAAQLEMVLAHELVHALQDQHVDLDSLVRASEDDNDRGSAAQAAIEGHATLAMLEWQMGRMTGREVDITSLPDLGARLAGLDLSALGEAGLPVLREAPRVVREALIFPYVRGLSFVQRLWRERPGRPPPFGEWLPASTEQVLHPERLLGSEPDAPSTVRFVGALPLGWTEVFADGLGEMETRVFLEEHMADGERAAEAAAGWDGDRFRLLRGPRGQEVLVWASVWDDAAEATAFRTAAREAYAHRYAGVSDRDVRISEGEVNGAPAVWIVDAPAGQPVSPAWPGLRFEVEPH